jgi:hypothetical protein
MEWRCGAGYRDDRRHARNHLVITESTTTIKAQVINDIIFSSRRTPFELD